MRSPDLTLISDLKASLSMRMDLHKVFTQGDSISSWGKFLRHFASVTEVKVTEKSTEEDVVG